MRALYIGIMSGTSMDGVDAVLVDTEHGVRLLDTHTEALAPSLKSKLLAISQPSDNEIDRMGELDIEVAQLFARAANNLLSKANIKSSDIIAIGSHGQTIRHRPRASFPFTLQIGDPNTIAELTGITTVADFRRRDIAAGGQGAPLVPAFHQALFSAHGLNRVILNLGGMANISILKADNPNSVYGFDTGPANVLMDAWAQRHINKEYDANGDWAKSGSALPALLAKLLAHPFFAKAAPKSTGREDFHIDWLISHLSGHENAADVQATLLSVTAHSVAADIKREGVETGELVLCGGGAFNDTLKAALQTLLPNMAIKCSSEFGIAPTWVEACAFAWLAKQCLNGLTGNEPYVTGASGHRVLGGIYPGQMGIPFVQAIKKPT